MSKDFNLSLNGVPINPENLPNEIDLNNLDKKSRDILSVFDTDAKKGVLSKNEIRKAVSFFFNNDPTKENENEAEISARDAEIIARKFAGGKFFADEIKWAVKQLLNSIQYYKDEEVIKKFEQVLKDNNLTLLVLGDNIDENLQGNFNTGEKCSYAYIDENGKVYKRTENGFEPTSVVIPEYSSHIAYEREYNKNNKNLIVSDDSIYSEDEPIKGADGTSAYKRTISAFHNGDLKNYQVLDTDKQVITNGSEAARILGFTPETERHGFLWLKERETGEYRDENNVRYTWNNKENVFCPMEHYYAGFSVQWFESAPLESSVRFGPIGHKEYAEIAREELEK